MLHHPSKSFDPLKLLHSLKKKQVEIGILIVLILSGFLFRFFYWQKFSYVAGDEGVQLILMDHFYRYGKLPLMGEISGLDSNSTYLIHNSPLGIYFLGIFYGLSFLKVEMYFFLYALLNLLQIYLLYRTAKEFFSTRAALITTMIASFSILSIVFSLWPSQPTNAIFFETLTFFFFSYFLKKKKSIYFLLSCLASLIALQMYPPAYLLLPAKLVIFYFFFRKLPQKKHFLTILSLATLLIYSPLLLMEVHYGFTNFHALQGFFTSPRSAASLNILRSFTLNLNLLTQLISYQSAQNTFAMTLLWSSILAIFSWSMFSKKKNLFIKKKLFVLFLFNFVPFLFTLLFFAKSDISSARAYLFVLLPYLFIWIGQTIAFSHRKLVIPLSLCLFVALTYNLPAYLPHPTSPTLPQIWQVSSFIYQYSRNTKTPLNEIDIFTISPEDEWNWTGSIYWYVLEQIANRQLVQIDFQSSKAVKLTSSNPSTVFLICHNFSEEESMDICLKKFQEKNLDLYGEFYFPWSIWKKPNVQVYIFKRNITLQ